jgi:methionine-rich copper-binding protein CopC
MTPGRVGTVVVATVAVLIVTLAVNQNAVPASLRAAVPADGARVAAAPDRVSLTFSAPVDPVLSHLVVTSAAGVPLGRGTPIVNGSTMVLPVSIHGNGTYRAVYHAVLAGGREVSGSTGFSVGIAGPAGDATGDTTDAHEHGVGPVSLAVIAVNAVLAVFLLVVLFRRRTPTAGEPATRP